MEISYLEDLATFSKTFNYSAAARELYTTPSTMSQRIAKMEKELGYPLVTHGQNPRLTAAGSVFCSKASQLVKQYHDLVNLCSEINEAELRTIRIADFRMCLPIAKTIAHISDIESLDVHYVSRELLLRYSEFEVLDKSVDDAVDISFTYAPDGSMDWFSDINREEYGFLKLPLETCAVLVSTSHPFAGRQTLSVKDLSSCTIAFVYTPLFMRSEKAMQKRLEASGREFSWISGFEGSQTFFLALSHDYAAVVFGTAMHASSDENEGVLEGLFLNDYDLTLQPYAIYRKDNHNSRVAEFMNNWEAELQRERQNEIPQMV